MKVRRGRGERGATLVESALITPVLMLFVFGIFEFGFAFRDYLAVANATRDGARAASVAGSDADADYRTLRAIQRASSALPDGAINYIVVYRAAGPDAEPDPSCLGSSQNNMCNVYYPADFSRPADQFGCDASTVAPLAPDRFWCPTDRETSVRAGLDYVGVYIEIDHTYITGLFGSGVTFDDTIVLKVEPQEQ